LNTLIIQPYKSLIDEIIPHLKSEGKDYSSNLIVFPGKRPSHFLRKAIAREIKGSFIPPVIFSMDEFVDHMYENMQSERKLETIDAVAILYDIQKKSLQPFGGENFLSPDTFFPIGLKIYRDIEELYIEGIKPVMVKQIEPYTSEAIPEYSASRLRSLSFFYEEFYKTLEEKGLSTRSLRYKHVSEKIEETGLDRYEQIIFAGFFALTKCENTLFRKLLRKENTLFIFQEGPGLNEKLSDLGLNTELLQNTDEGYQVRHSAPPQADDAESMSSDPLNSCFHRNDNFTRDSSPEIHFYSSPDTHGQVYALSRVIEEIQESPDEKTAIVLPSSETLFPLLRQALSTLNEDSYNVSLGYPLHRTPIFGFLNNLMELISSIDDDRLYIPDYLKFVLHPYTKNIYYNGNAEITRIMFHAIEERLTQYRTKTFCSLSEIEEDAKLLGHIMEKMPEDEKGISRSNIKEHLRNIHRNTIEKFLSFTNLKDFAEKCTELLTYIFKNSTGRLHPLFYPFSESFLKAMDVITRSLMNDFAFEAISSYFIFFRKYIMTGYTPFEGTPLRGLQILGFLETRNIRFDRVFILDSNEEVLPDTRKDDTILPFKAREILGLPTYIDRDNLAAYYFETLLKGAREAHLFFIENNKKDRSRFIEKILWEKQKKDNTTDTKKYIQHVQYKVKLDNPASDSIIKTDSVLKFLRDFEYSATALDTYLDCQLQFYYTYVLGLNKKEEISSEIERADIGKFVHKILAEYFSKRKNRQLKQKDFRKEDLISLINRLFKEEYGARPIGAVYLLKNQIKNHLRDLFEKYYMPLIKEQRITILDSEKDIRISSDGFKLKGRIDSIEKRDGKLFIIDYKTGSNRGRLKIHLDKLDADNRESYDKAIGSLQLPFYLLLYSSITRTDVKDLSGVFLLLGQTIINKDIELCLFENGDEEHVFATLKAVIFRLLREIVDPVYPFKPTSDKKATCPNCNFNYICGTQWIVK
jgi:CRISPR/Cas system-associated exonuclease Cas4 (RecB family)